MKLIPLSDLSEPTNGLQDDYLAHVAAIPVTSNTFIAPQSICEDDTVELGENEKLVTTPTETLTEPNKPHRHFQVGDEVILIKNGKRVESSYISDIRGSKRDYPVLLSNGSIFSKKAGILKAAMVMTANFTSFTQTNGINKTKTMRSPKTPQDWKQVRKRQKLFDLFMFMLLLAVVWLLFFSYINH